MAETSTRLLMLLSLLQNRRDWPGPMLAERLKVSPRTMRRDIDQLRLLGYRVRATKGPDGGYRLDAGSELPPLLFDDDQAVAIAIALQSAAVYGASFAEAAERALTTVRQVMPARLRRRIDQLELTALPHSSTSAPTLDVLSTVSAARASHEVLRFNYATESTSLPPGSVARPRQAEPHHVVFRGERWYLVAWDLDRVDWRIFRIDRMHPRIPTGPRFTPREVPGGDVVAFISSRFKGSDGVDRWPCQGEVILRSPAHAIAPYVEDGTVESLAQDRCRWQLGSWSWVAMAARIAQFDAEIEVVGPLALHEAFETLALRFARTTSYHGLSD